MVALLSLIWFSTAGVREVCKRIKWGNGCSGIVTGTQYPLNKYYSVREKWVEVNAKGRADERSGWRQGWLLDLTVFSTLGAVCYLLAFISSLIFPPFRCEVSWRKRHLEGKGVMRMERSAAKCGYWSPALGLFPAFLDFETHALSAGQGSLQSCCGGFSPAVLPAPKAASMPTHTSQSRWFLLLSMWSENEMDF